MRGACAGRGCGVGAWRCGGVCMLLLLLLLLLLLARKVRGGD